VPAAAVIPAPIAYIKVVAVKKLVVGFQVKPVGVWSEDQCLGWKPQRSAGSHLLLIEWGRALGRLP